ncbi:hypothetical protein [Flagellimonas flava]|uniref:hypothetical protein n=1 Tax=Flagellimonas flava TaxID=570519 RepID=UPI003D65924A
MAQSTFETNILTPLKNQQPYFEKIYVHTNKEIYPKTDIVWFKVYVATKTNMPALTTTLVYVDLFDSDGNLIETNNVLINKGVGVGQFFLSEDLPGKDVYLQAYTNYMKNFGEENVYHHRLDLLDKTYRREGLSNTLYDVQFFPEGGNFLEGVENTMGIKALVNGEHTGFEGYVVNSNREKIVSFSEEHLGMAKCSFGYAEGEHYEAVIQIRDTVIRKALPKAKRTGFALSISNRTQDSVMIQLLTNENTLRSFEGNYSLLLHQKNQLIDYLSIDSIKSNKIEIIAEKKLFQNGVNSVTIFKGDTPVLGRKFFVERPDSPRSNIGLQPIKKEQDSILYELTTLDRVTKHPIRTNLSVSVLSVNDDYAYINRASMVGAYLLLPYIRGHVDKPFYYFNENNKKRLEHLDLLLLTQGWVQYQQIIQELHPKVTNDFELGFHLKGKVGPIASDSLVLLSNKDEIIDKISLQGKKEFDFKKLLIYKGDSIKIAFLENGSEAIKPQTLFVDTVTRISLPLKWHALRKPHVPALESEAFSDFFDELDNDNITRLDEVEVSTKQLSKRRLERKRLIKKYKPLVSHIGLYYNMDISDTYRSKNYNIFQFLNRDGVVLNTWNGEEWYLTAGGNEAQLVVDGKPARSDDLRHLNLRMTDVENVFVASVRGHRSYQVFTTDNYKKGIEELFQGHVVKKGYDKSIKYYTPLYEFDRQPLPIKEIDWKPKLVSGKKGRVTFKISNNSLPNPMFLIRGFSVEGHIIEETISMD